MFKPKFFITAITALFFFAMANAQVDTTKFDLGRIQLKKDFTQSVTVKGSDLETMPFDNLADAINAWFYGAYTSKVSLVYIIDGNLVNDVNAYSIYDIDEITLIQNAVTQVSGTTQQQQLVLIKTKRSKTKGLIIEANGQANISSLYINNIPDNTTNASNSSITYKTGQKSTTALYQQYNVSARGNTGDLQYGLSADYLRDEMPEIKDPSTTYEDPLSISRFRFNGYLTAKLGSSTVDVTAGYAPQTENEKYDMTNTYNNDVTNNKQNEGIFNGSVRLTTHIIPGLVNDLHGDYNSYHLDANGSMLSTSTYLGNTTTELSSSTNGNRDHDIVAYDNLSYTAKFGGWALEPAANISFRTFRDSTYSNSSNTLNGNSENSFSGDYYRLNQHLFLLTPALNVYYKSLFNIEGGFLYNLSSSGEITGSGIKDKKLFPFVTASADVTGLIDPASDVAVKIYGSYSLSDHIPDNFNSLQDFDPVTTQIPLQSPNDNLQTLPYNGYGTIYNVNYASELQLSTKSFYTLSGGLSVSPQKSNLVFSYFFDKRTFLGPVYAFVPYGYNGVQYEVFFDDVTSISQRFSIDYSLYKSSQFSWTTGINSAMIKQTYSAFYSINSQLVEGSGEWTGGWVNRLNYHSFFAGIDVLYEINGKTYTSATISNYYEPLIAHRADSFSLQNLYLGYTIKTAKFKNLKVFANARNIFQNQKEDITDSRKYYGLGLQLSL